MNEPILFLTGVLVLGMLAQWLAWTLRLPSILLLLAFGFGARYFAGADPDTILDADLLFPLVSLSVAVILFEGGLTLKLHELHESGQAVFRLCTVGALVSWVLTALAATWLMGMSGGIAALVGAILVVTGPTVIGPLLRHIRPDRRVGSIVKWEGIVIDPIGAMLAVLVFELLLSGAFSEGSVQLGGRVQMAAAILWRTLVIGVTISALSATVLILLIRSYRIPDFLKNPMFLAFVVLAYTISDRFQTESGLLTVTLLGIILANQKYISVDGLLEFKENLQVLLISALFIVLSSRIGLDELSALGWGGLAFVALLIVVIRPISVLASTWRTKLEWRERLFLSCLAPRGIVAAAVASVFALEVAHRGHELQHALPAGTDALVPLTFLVIVGTVAVYGLCSGPVARFLGLASPNPQGILFGGANAWICQIAEALQFEGFAVQVVDTNYRNIASARMKGIPVTCASLMSDSAAEEIDLGGIGRLLAMTPNDELNRLVAMRFRHDFGTSGVYQLPFGVATGGGKREATLPQEARFLFGRHATYSYLSGRFADGAIVKRTLLTNEFTYDDFLSTYGEDVLLLFLKTESGKLDVGTAKLPLKPKPGQTVIALVTPPDETSD